MGFGSRNPLQGKLYKMEYQALNQSLHYTTRHIFVHRERSMPECNDRLIAVLQFILYT
jgi:hypothetical protein